MHRPNRWQFHGERLTDPAAKIATFVATYCYAKKLSASLVLI